MDEEIKMYHASWGVACNCSEEEEYFDTYQEASDWCAKKLTDDNHVTIETTTGW